MNKLPVMTTAKLSTIHEKHVQFDAHFLERDGFALVRDYGDVRSEYLALSTGAGVIDLPHFGALRVEGRDHISWLHKMVTADVLVLQPGQGAYSLLLEAKGHVLADFVLLIRDDHALLYASGSAKEKLYANLKRTIFRDKVTLSDVSNSFALLSLQGPSAKLVIDKIVGSIRTLENFQFESRAIANYQILIVRNPRAATDGYDLIAPRDAVESLWDALVANDAQPVGFATLNVARVQAGIPWFEDDFDETTLALEARLDKFIAENKGCYPGQEVISRIRNRGHVNRRLVQFEIAGDVTPARGDSVLVDSNPAGEITSPVWSFAQNAPLALGYLRREVAENGARVQISREKKILEAKVSSLS